MLTPRFKIFLSALAAFLVLTAGPLRASNIAKVSAVDGGMPYLLHLPEIYEDEPAREFPTIIYLHGFGERCADSSYGTTSELYRLRNARNTPTHHVENGNPLKFTVNDQDEYFILISPQVRRSRGDWKAEDVIALLDEVAAEYRIDPDRVYLTGFSFGGQGTWNVLTGDANTPNRFAAAAVVAGRSVVTNQHGKIAEDNVAVWSMSGLDDGTEHTPEKVLTANNALRIHLPEAEHRVTMYPGYAHQSYKQYNLGHYYHNPNLYEWFLSKTRQVPGKPERVNLSDRTETIATAGDEESGQPSERVKRYSNSYWASSTSNYDDKWVQLDLGDVFSVDQVFLRFSWSTSAAIEPVAPKGRITSIEASPTAGRIRVYAPFHNRRAKNGQIPAHQIYLKDTHGNDGGPYTILNDRDYNKETGWFEVEGDFSGDSTGTWYTLNETVAAYQLQGSLDGSEWFSLAEEDENYEFSRQHKFDPTLLRFVRLKITDPNRTDLPEYEHRAKVYEMAVLESYAPPEVPVAPTEVNISDVTSGSLTLSWSGATGMIDEYFLYWSTEYEQPPAPQARISGTQNNFKVENLAPETEYFFWITASNAGGQSDAITASQTTDILVPPLAPTLFTANGPTATSLSLSWQDNADNESAYHLYSSTSDQKPSSPNFILDPDTRGILVENLTPNTRYYFWLAASNAAGQSPSASVTETTSDFEGSLANNLLSRWKFDSGNETTAFDSTGFNDAAFGGDASPTDESVAGRAIHFDGNDDWTAAPHKDAYSSDALSVSLWVRPSIADSQPRGLISKRQGLSANQRCFSIFSHTNSNLNLDIGSQRFTTDYSLNEVDVWKHLVMTFDGSASTDNLKLYSDGIEVASTTISINTIPVLDCPVTIGILNTGYGTGFAGEIDEVRLYDRVLAPSEIQALYETEPLTGNSPVPNYSEWVDQHLGDLPDTDRDPSADPDHDGIPNLLEFAQGSPPNQSGSGNLPDCAMATENNEHYFEFSYRRRQGGTGNAESGYTVGDLRYTVEMSPDLSPDSWVTGSDYLETIPPAIDHGDHFETVTVRAKQSVETTSTIFFRLQVEELNQ
ncbi:fibronectin type III domain-containing protein [Puniceicoccus vermicola]|uniref:Fibronectin type III domain-containing protein n=1 Tax=Puniceicoccus vermicola TaxID=388746 RepID=A0A7X1AUT9_9BACT|nr:fibronectin type III domain-containing protein [Puniceicoccus vermicola]MBC2600416.1 fibronectin type III domain-containing protein [Puniceicoccus vermicola]